jgi:Barstar (barnase inhibitor)
MTQMIRFDLTDVTTLKLLHEQLAKAFGFPDFYGKNYPALVDCLSSLRYPEDGMSTVTIKSKDESIELQLRNLSLCATDVIRTFLSAIEAVNYRDLRNGYRPSIVISLVS